MGLRADGLAQEGVGGLRAFSGKDPTNVAGEVWGIQGMGVGVGGGRVGA